MVIGVIFWAVGRAQVGETNDDALIARRPAPRGR
jgi:hypothetical protein